MDRVQRLALARELRLAVLTRGGPPARLFVNLAKLTRYCAKANRRVILARTDTPDALTGVRS